MKYIECTILNTVECILTKTKYTLFVLFLLYRRNCELMNYYLYNLIFVYRDKFRNKDYILILN